MKKIISLMCVLILLASSAAAYAEGTQFTLRSGLAWGMSPDEVAAIEGDDAGWQEKENGLAMLGYDDVRVSRYTADFGAVFANGKLFFCLYFLDWDDRTMDYLSNALASKYGESQAVNVSVINAFMDCIDSGDYIADLTDGQEWIVGDTTVWLYTYTDQIMISYYLTDFDWSEIGLYDTFGL